MAKGGKSFDIVRPQAEHFLQSVRSFGYTVETAIADLIDNSITAEASCVNITYGISHFSSYVRIEDDGKGMNQQALINAMKIGSFNPLDPRRENDLGRFGLGLKTASFSQCRRLTVKSRSKSGNTVVRCWDLDLVARKKDWILLHDSFDSNSEEILGNISSNGSGTVILWEKLDRLLEVGEKAADKEHFYRKFDNVRKHLGLVFHRYIEENLISIKVLNNEIVSINPFHISKNAPTTELAEEHLSIDKKNISVQPFILPHESKLSTEERSQIEIIRGWTEHQGIYLYRNQRLISDGTWLDLDFKKKESQRLCRIRIDIPNTLDKEWQIDVKKASAKIPDSIRKQIKNICFSSIEKAIKVYTHRGAYVKRRAEKKEIVYLWKARQKHGKRYYEINSDHPVYQLILEYLEDESYVFKDFIRLVGETLPINFIVNDFSDPAIIMKEFFEDSKGELRRIYENTIKALINAGLTESEAIDKASRIESFQQLS
ncbi:MAG: ATP-binding protein [Cyclobacteriaceae bacterium]|nr:ATP-binding protein [Cyclobacteriaceae bacterium]